MTWQKFYISFFYPNHKQYFLKGIINNGYTKCERKKGKKLITKGNDIHGLHF